MHLCMYNMNLHFVFAQFYNAEKICTTNALYFVQINEETGNRRPIMLAFPSPEEMSENGNKEESKEPSVETVHSGMDREKDLIAIYVQSRHIKAYFKHFRHTNSKICRFYFVVFPQSSYFYIAARQEFRGNFLTCNLHIIGLYIVSL